MKPLARLFGAALVGAFALLATPAAQAQVGVNINIGAPAWGPQVPYGTQYYYIPEIDGYYDLYAQQYIVYQDGYWVPLPQLYGYDPYQFHPVVIQYRGREPWLQSSYYHQRYAYQPYRSYGRGGYGNGYYSNGYGRGNYPGGYYGNGRSHYNDRDNWGNGYGNGRNNNGGYGSNGYNNGPRGNQTQPGGSGPRLDQVQYPGGTPRGGQPQVLQPPQSGGNGGHGGPPQGGPGNGSGQGGGRHGRD